MKKILTTMMLLTLALAMTACAAKDKTTVTDEPQATATNSPEMAPQSTGMLPGVGDMMDLPDAMIEAPTTTTAPQSTGVTSMEKARSVVESIEDELERLSEVDDAQVIIAGNKAAVALEFDDQYQGGIDDRLRDIVKERIASVISGVTDISITADQAIMDELEALGERLDTMSDMTALQSDLDAVIKKIEGKS